MENLIIEYKKGYAVVQINSGKVNTITSGLSSDLCQAFTQLEEDDKVKGVILTGRPHCFSAGLDVVEMATGGKEGTQKFWRNLLTALQIMIRFPKPLVAAITGYAPAGATILALTADYRVMGKGAKHVMGMHEFKMSMLIPEMLCDIYAYFMGEKEAWEAVQQQKLYNSDGALAVGLVNESVEVDEVMATAEKHLASLMNVYLPVFSKSKEYLRQGLLKIVDRPIEPMVDDVLKSGEDPFVVQSMKMFLASLKK